MGSRMMHYGISALVGRQIGANGSADFLLGGIAPDVHKQMKEPKKTSHFIETDGEGKFYIDYMGFCAKYERMLHTPFYLGYLCHLIADDIWFGQIFDPRIRHQSPEEQRRTYEAGYRDFWRLNGVIVKKYALEYRRPQIPEAAIDEIETSFLPDLLDSLENDFRFEEQVSNEPLELFAYDEIYAYMERSAEACIQFITARK